MGDEVEVEIQFDNEYKSGPTHPMPSYLREALDNNLKANQHWEKLIPSRQKEILRYFSWLKSDEAKARNLTQLLHVLSGGKARYMARDWNADN